MFGPYRSRASEFIQQSRGSRQLMAETAAESSHLDHTQKNRERAHVFWNLKSHPQWQISYRKANLLFTPPQKLPTGDQYLNAPNLWGSPHSNHIICTCNRIFCCGTSHLEYHKSLQQPSKHCGYGVFKLELSKLYLKIQFKLSYICFIRKAKLTKYLLFLSVKSDNLRHLGFSNVHKTQSLCYQAFLFAAYIFVKK